MTKIVVDTNILFSAFLNTSSRIAQILIYGGSYYEFYSPEYVKSEISAHRNKIIKLSKNDQ